MSFVVIVFISVCFCVIDAASKCFDFLRCVIAVFWQNLWLWFMLLMPLFFLPGVAAVAIVIVAHVVATVVVIVVFKFRPSVLDGFSS